jgi:hypothetical protein
MSDHERARFMRNLWRWAAGEPEQDTAEKRLDFNELYESEWSEAFERMMRWRLVHGSIRYGLLNAPGKPQYDRIDAIIRRARTYAQTGNVDLLADIANFALHELEEGTHPNRHLDGSAHADTVAERDFWQWVTRTHPEKADAARAFLEGDEGVEVVVLCKGRLDCETCKGTGIDYDSDGRDRIWEIPCHCVTERKGKQ